MCIYCLVTDVFYYLNWIQCSTSTTCMNMSEINLWLYFIKCQLPIWMELWVSSVQERNHHRAQDVTSTIPTFIFLVNDEAWGSSYRGDMTDIAVYKNGIIITFIVWLLQVKLLIHYISCRNNITIIITFRVNELYGHISVILHMAYSGMTGKLYCFPCGQYFLLHLLIFLIQYWNTF